MITLYNGLILDRPSLEERVFYGAVLLDNWSTLNNNRWFLGWEFKIDLDILEMGGFARNPGPNSILGQLFGSFGKALQQIQYHQLAINLEYYYWRGGFCLIADESTLNDDLIQHWKSLINERRKLKWGRHNSELKPMTVLEIVKTMQELERYQQKHP